MQTAPGSILPGLTRGYDIISAMADTYSNATTRQSPENQRPSSGENPLSTAPLPEDLLADKLSAVEQPLDNQLQNNSAENLTTSPISGEAAGQTQTPEQAEPAENLTKQASEQSAYQQAVVENITQINQEREQQEIAAAREEIRQAQMQVQQSGDKEASHQLDEDVDAFINQQNKGIFHRGMFAAITFFAAYHHKKAQRELVSRRRSNSKTGATYGEHDQEQQQSSQNLG